MLKVLGAFRAVLDSILLSLVGYKISKYGSMWRRRITPLHFFELQNTVFVAIFEQIWWSRSKKKVHMKKARLKKIYTSLFATEWRCAKFPSRFATFVAIIGTFCHGVKLFLKCHVLNIFLVVFSSLWSFASHLSKFRLSEKHTKSEKSSSWFWQISLFT